MLKVDELEEIRLKAYENFLIYKEITKRYHDKNLVRREFQVRHKVLLYNSRPMLFPGKLKSRWSVPFIVNKVFANGVGEVQDPGYSHTFMVNGQRIKIYSGGKVPYEKVSLILTKP